MLTEINNNEIFNILNSKKIYVFDLDGTIYLGNKSFPFAVNFINNLRKNGKRILFFTNNASHDPVFYMEKLTRLGFSPTFDEICTSGDVTCTFLNTNRRGKKVYLLGTKQLWRQFRKYGIDLINDENGIPDGRIPDIVVTSFDTQLTYEKLSYACEFIRGGAEYICTHPDFNCPTETGFIPDSGAISAAVFASTGVKPLFMGKPYPETARMISVMTQEDFSKIVIFGDRIYTDIATGKQNGITAVLVLTGESTLNDIDKADEVDLPDILLDSLETADNIMYNEKVI